MKGKAGLGGHVTRLMLDINASSALRGGKWAIDPENPAYWCTNDQSWPQSGNSYYSLRISTAIARSRGDLRSNPVWRSKAFNRLTIVFRW